MLLGIRALSARRQYVSRKALREFTGRAEWVAGMLPQLKPFVQMLWAALSTSSLGPDKVWIRQVKVALCWLEAFFALSQGPLTKTTFADPPSDSASGHVRCLHDGGRSIVMGP
jgi:hypothetical protein